jgi:hypothetical protein
MHIDKSICGKMYDERADSRVDRWMDGWMDIRTEGLGDW